MGRHCEKKSYNILPTYNLCRRLLTLIVMLVVLFLTYCYNIMGVAKDNTSKEKNDIIMQFNANTTKQAKSVSKIITIKKIYSQNPLSTVKCNRDKLSEAKELFQISSEEFMESSTKETLRYVSVSHPNPDVSCKMFSCFNYTRCPLTGKFPIYVYDLDELYNVDTGVTAPIKEILSANTYITLNPAKACIFLVITELSFRKKNRSKSSYKILKEMVLSTLPHWGRGGQNHVLLNLGHSTLAAGTGSAIIAQSMFTHEQFRPGFDVVIPPAHGPIKGEVWYLSPPIAPARRKIFLSFQGSQSSVMRRNPERVSLIKKLKQIKWSNIGDLQMRFKCKKVQKLSKKWKDDWPLCHYHKWRTENLSKSTFVLIIAPGTYVYASTNLLQTRLYEALESGAIPVILGGDRIRLPYEEVLDWRKAVIRLPMARVSELKFVLENMIDEDILAFRKHGRMLWEKYLGSVQASVDTLLAVIRIRLNIPPRPVQSMSPSIFNFLVYKKEGIKSYEMPKTKPLKIAALNVAKKQATTYKRNFTVGLLNGYELWNSWEDPFASYPELPWDPILLPPEVRYLNSSVSEHYHETCSPLAGDQPKENFTVVILTYNRTTTLKEAISNLSRLPYLHKIVVICNGPKPSTKGWPTNVPIALVRAAHNSLSNRFLPYDLIETEAVYSADDDAVPSEESEIIFAFKVWRGHRDQIVGFFGRNYGLDNKLENGFTYNTNYEGKTACDVSMVLTGAAFIHRYYLWAYWRQLPVSVRRFIDKHNNCEDIAMNFLVAHITGKPPIKVTSKWAEEKENNPPSYRRLSARSSHYQDRKACIDFFSEVMGYNPLRNTHYRVETFPKAKFWFWENMIRGHT